jgi:hypothetical protein
LELTGVSDWTREELLDYASEVCPHCPLDIGIARAVRILRSAGINTYESCEGGEGHAFSEPTIKLSGTPEAGWQAIGRLLTYKMPVRRFSQAWSFDFGALTGPHWEVTFWRKLD